MTYRGGDPRKHLQWSEVRQGRERLIEGVLSSQSWLSATGAYSAQGLRERMKNIPHSCPNWEVRRLGYLSTKSPLSLVNSRGINTPAFMACPVGVLTPLLKPENRSRELQGFTVNILWCVEVSRWGWVLTEPVIARVRKEAGDQVIHGQDQQKSHVLVISYQCINKVNLRQRNQESGKWNFKILTVYVMPAR